MKKIAKAKSKFKPLEIIVFTPPYRVKKKWKHPLKFGEVVIFMGNIPNAPGHCAVAKRNGSVIWLLHPEDFRKAKDTEI